MSNPEVEKYISSSREQKISDAEMAKGSTDWSFKAVEWLYAHDPSDTQAASPSSFSHTTQPSAGTIPARS